MGEALFPLWAFFVREPLYGSRVFAFFVLP
jgi:hypothetical protein